TLSANAGCPPKCAPVVRTLARGVSRILRLPRGRRRRSRAVCAAGSYSSRRFASRRNCLSPHAARFRTTRALRRWAFSIEGESNVRGHGHHAQDRRDRRGYVGLSRHFQCNGKGNRPDRETKNLFHQHIESDDGNWHCTRGAVCRNYCVTRDGRQHAKEFEESMTGAGLAGLDAGRAYSFINELSYKMPLKLAEGVQMYHAMSSLLGGPKAAEAILPQVAALSHEFKRNVSPDIASIFTSLGIQGPGKEKEREQVLDLISQAHSFAGPNFHLSDVVQQFKRMKSAGMALEMSELPMIFAQIAQDAKGGSRGGVGGGVGQFAHEMHAIATEFEKAKSAVHTRKDGTVVTSSTPMPPQRRRRMATRC